MVARCDAECSLSAGGAAASVVVSVVQLRCGAECQFRRGRRWRNLSPRNGVQRGHRTNAMRAHAGRLTPSTDNGSETRARSSSSATSSGHVYVLYSPANVPAPNPERTRIGRFDTKQASSVGLGLMLQSGCGIACWSRDMDQVATNSRRKARQWCQGGNIFTSHT